MNISLATFVWPLTLYTFAALALVAASPSGFGEPTKTKEFPSQGATGEVRGSKANISTLVSAAARGDAPRVVALLGKGLDPNAEDDHGHTALVSAFAHLGVLKILLAAGARLDQPDGRRCTVLMMASSNGSCESHDFEHAREVPAAHVIDSIKFLLSLHPNVEATSFGGTPRGMTALEFAAAALQGSVGVNLLLDAGAKVEGPDCGARCRYGHENPALCRAAEAGNTGAVTALLTAGANKETKLCLSDTTPLIVAAKSGRADTVRVLLAAGANIEGRDRFGLFNANAPITSRLNYATALIWAVREGKIEVVKILLEAGASIWTTDHWGNCALDIARSKKREDIVELMVNSANRN